jgi:hypothetical protein
MDALQYAIADVLNFDNLVEGGNVEPSAHERT